MKRTLAVTGGLVLAALAVFLTALGGCGSSDTPGTDDPSRQSESTTGMQPSNGQDGPEETGETGRQLPSGVVAGTVVDRAGRPIFEAEVAVLMSQNTGVTDETGQTRPTRQDLFEKVLKTDAVGWFQIDGVPDRKTVPRDKAAGLADAVTCILYVQKEGYRMAWRDVRPGGLELRIVLEETAAVVSGRVVAKDTGQPLPGAHIKCRPGEVETTADAGGVFTLTVPVQFEPPARVNVSVICYPVQPDYAPQELRDVALEQGEMVGDLLFELDRGTMTLEGSLVDGQTQKPVTGAFVRLREYDQMHYYYFPDETQAEIVADADDGTFRFDHVRPGMLQLDAVLRDTNCRVGRYQLTLEEGVAPEAIRVFVNTTSPIITGTVTDPSGAPVKGAAVWLLQGQRIVMYEPSATDAKGRYGFQSYYDPGQQPLSVMVFDPDYALAIAAVGREKQQLMRVDVALKPGATIAGTVTDEQGDPVQKATVTIDGPPLGPVLPLSYDYLPNPRAPVVTKADGAFAFSYLPDGTYEVVVAHGSYVIQERAVEVAAGAAQEADFVLDKGATIAGTVYDENGNPLRVRSVVAVSPSGRELDSAASGGDGRFVLRRLPRHARVTLLVLADLVDLRQDETFYHAKLEGVETGRDDVRIDATLYRLGSVELQVVDAKTGEPIPRYEVWCSWSAPTGIEGLARQLYIRSMYGRASVDSEQGRVTIDRLFPSEHRFSITADGYNSVLSDAVEVTSGGTASVRLALERRPEQPRNAGNDQGDEEDTGD